MNHFANWAGTLSEHDAQTVLALLRQYNWPMYKTAHHYIWGADPCITCRGKGKTMCDRALVSTVREVTSLVCKSCNGTGDELTK